MSSLTRTMLPAFALAAMMATAQAQTTADQDHNAHHPADQGVAQTQVAPATPVPSPQGTASSPMPTPMGSGGMPMMGRGMPQGGQAGSSSAMSCAMMGQHAAMGASVGMGMPFEHVEGRIAFLKAELKITDAQTAPWNAFADALRANAKAHQAVHEQMTKTGMPSAWTDRLTAQQKILTMRLDGIKSLEAATKPLFAVLTAEQKALADRMLTGPMGMM